MAKKKVSFDIDEELVENIKKFCEERKIKFSNFLRLASEEKYDRDKMSMNIFLPYQGRVMKFTIKRTDFVVELREASEEMKENVGAVCEGSLRLRKDHEKVNRVPRDVEGVNSYNNYSFLKENILESGSMYLNFYTRDYYPKKTKYDHTDALF